MLAEATPYELSVAGSPADHVSGYHPAVDETADEPDTD